MENGRWLSDAALGARLDARREQGFLVPLQPAPGATYNQCHENAEAYVCQHVGFEVVRGWLIEEFADFTYFNAHSVVRDTSGQMFDPTPMRQHCLFLLHDGDEEDFAVQRYNRPRIQYPVVELDWYDLGAPVEDDPVF
jgi:hypothetical protein